MCPKLSYENVKYCPENWVLKNFSKFKSKKAKIVLSEI